MSENGQIVIELDKVYGEGSVAHAIVEHAAELVIARATEAVDEFAQRVRSISDEVLREKLTPVLEQAIEAAVQPTDRFGQPKGELKTLREVIVERVESELRRAASRDGLNYLDGRHREYPLLQFLVDRQVDKVVREDLKEAMTHARKQVKEAVEAKGAELLTETIERMRR